MKHINGKSYIQYSEGFGEIVIDKLFVHKDERGDKKGHSLLSFVLIASQNQGFNMSLCAESDEPSNINNEQLIEYYEEFGFESDADCDQLMTYYI